MVFLSYIYIYTVNSFFSLFVLGNPSSSESEVPATTGDSETPESSAAVGACGDGGDGASNPQPRDDLDSGKMFNNLKLFFCFMI